MPTVGTASRRRGWRRRSKAGGELREAPSDPLDHGRDRLAEADAHRRDAEASLAPLELVQEGRSHPRPGCPERMAQRDAAAVRIDVRPALPEPRVPHELQ